MNRTLSRTGLICLAVLGLASPVWGQVYYPPASHRVDVLLDSG